MRFLPRSSNDKTVNGLLPAKIQKNQRYACTQTLERERDFGHCVDVSQQIIFDTLELVIRSDREEKYTCL